MDWLALKTSVLEGFSKAECSIHLHGTAMQGILTQVFRSTGGFFTFWARRACSISTSASQGKSLAKMQKAQKVSEFALPNNLGFRNLKGMLSFLGLP